MKQVTMKLKELAYIYKKTVELRSVGANSCTSTGNALSTKIDVAQQSTPCKHSHLQPCASILLLEIIVPTGDTKEHVLRTRSIYFSAKQVDLIQTAFFVN